MEKNWGDTPSATLNKAEFLFIDECFLLVDIYPAFL